MKTSTYYRILIYVICILLTVSGMLGVTFDNNSVTWVIIVCAMFLGAKIDEKE